MSSMSSDITYLVMEKFFPDTNMSDMQPFILYSINLRPSFAKLIKYNQPTTNPVASLICEIKLKYSSFW